MIISDFTKFEVDFLLENCNFTDKEELIFCMRSKNMKLEYIAEEMEMSIDGIKKISRKINKKIIRVL